jgi:Bacterial Ig domain/Chondroitinase B
MFVLCLVLLLVPALVWAQPACTHWAAPSGTGSTCTQSAPCLVDTWVASEATPGRVLCLQDGMYGSISIPSTFAGTAQQRIWLRAEHEGQATIGWPGSRPLHLQGSYGGIWGLNLKGGDNAVLRFYTNSRHWLVQRVAMKGEGGKVDSGIDMAGQGNVLEDFAYYGEARYSSAAATSGSSGNTMRRGWVRWQGKPPSVSGPAASSLMGYGQDGVTMENVILTQNRTDGASNEAGVSFSWRTVGSKFLGNILYILPTDVFHDPALASFTTDAGSQAQEGDFKPTRDLQFAYNVAVIGPGHPAFGQRRGLLFSECTDHGCQPGSNNLIRHNVSVAGLANAITPESWTPSNNQWGTTKDAAIGAGKSLWTDSQAAPGVCFRIVNGATTTEPLWPFDMNTRLMNFMRDNGDTPVDVTATLEGLLGPIPAQCRKGAPTPPTDTTPPRVTLTAPTHEAIISGTVAVAATATDETGVRGIQFFLDNAPVGTEQPGANAHVLADSTRAGNGIHLLKARAYDLAGNVAESDTIDVNIHNAPTPQPPAAALTCTGDLLAGGKLAMECLPQARKR